ncbi:MAG: CidA/LrgA family protein [Lachnospiraceae bacterium]|nr:CidA/LrgA family protein [Lachnospiraceae bacterium]
MKYMRQIARIAGFAFVGELLNTLIPLPVPASVYGMLLLLFCLCTGIVKLEQIEETADFLVEIMPLVFVMPGVAVIESLGLLADSLVGIIVISILSTLLVYAVTGLTAQALVRLRRRREEQHG